MKIDRRITNGLAWAGVALVVGIPTADLLSAQFMGDGAARAPQLAVIAPAAPMPLPLSQRPAAPVAEVAVVAPVVKPVEVAKPAAPTAAQTANAVDAFLQSGKPLPSYINGSNDPAPTQVAATPPVREPIAAPVTAPEVDPIQVAAIPTPTKIAPTPMPLSMRPRITTPAIAAAQPVLIIPDTVVAPLPPADVTAGDLEDWESGPLSEFLAARQQQANSGNNSDAYYDADGFFLDEGPNRPRAPRNRNPGPDNGQVYFFPFSN